MKDEAREDWIRKKLETYLKDLAQFSQEEGKMTRLPFTGCDGCQRLSV